MKKKFLKFEFQGARNSMSLDADPPAQICFKNAILDGGSGKASIRVRRGRFEIVL